MRIWRMAYWRMGWSLYTGHYRPYAISHRPSARGSGAAGRSAVAADHRHVARDDPVLAPSAQAQPQRAVVGEIEHLPSPRRRAPATWMWRPMSGAQRAPRRGDRRKAVAAPAARSAPRARSSRRAGEARPVDRRAGGDAQRGRLVAQLGGKIVRLGVEVDADAERSPRAPPPAPSISARMPATLRPLDQDVVRPLDRRRAPLAAPSRRSRRRPAG